MNDSAKQLNFSVSQPDSSRIDGYLAKIFVGFSRATITSWIASGNVILNSTAITKNNTKVNYKDHIQVTIPETNSNLDWGKENIPLDIIFEDSDILVINKPSNLTMHPGAGQSSGTLANALAYYNHDLTTIPRMGIVHRLDKDTTGVLVIAKTSLAHHSLVKQLENREVTKIYHALVNGIVIAGGTIDAPIARHPKHRTIMAVNDRGKDAVTHYRILHKYKEHTLLQVNIETGRTHQIRVHMQHIKYGIVGDRTYARAIIPKGASSKLISAIKAFQRQALHAYQLEFMHPVTQKQVSFTAPYPDDLKNLLELIT